MVGSSGRVTLQESGTARNKGRGVWLVKIISADVQGSSGFWPGSVLERDAPKAFPTGTHYYIDHKHPDHSGQLKERSLRDLAAVQIGPPRYGDEGEGLGVYADVQLLPNHRETVEDTAEHAGVSVNVIATREHDPARGFVVTELIEGLSVDFVSRAGAGGRLVAMTESAREGSVNTNQGTPAAPPFTLAETDKQGLNKLYQAVEGLGARLDALQEKAAAKASEEPKTLTPGEVVAALDAAKLPAASRKRVADAAAVPGADLKALIAAEEAVVADLRREMGTDKGEGEGGTKVPDDASSLLDDAGQGAPQQGGAQAGAQEGRRLQLTESAGGSATDPMLDTINSLFSQGGGI